MIFKIITGVFFLIILFLLYTLDELTDKLSICNTKNRSCQSDRPISINLSELSGDYVTHENKRIKITSNESGWSVGNYDAEGQYKKIMQINGSNGLTLIMNSVKGINSGLQRTEVFVQVIEDGVLKLKCLTNLPITFTKVTA
jgi:hypothetical protein